MGPDISAVATSDEAHCEALAPLLTQFMSGSVTIHASSAGWKSLHSSVQLKLGRAVPSLNALLVGNLTYPRMWTWHGKHVNVKQLRTSSDISLVPGTWAGRGCGWWQGQRICVPAAGWGGGPAVAAGVLDLHRPPAISVGRDAHPCPDRAAVQCGRAATGRGG